MHGIIRSSPDKFPDREDACERSILPVSRRDLKVYREKSRDMRAAAKAELRRRSLFADALEQLSTDPKAAILLFRRAAAIDLFVEDLEEMADLHRGLLERDPDLRAQLCGMFVKAYSDKFGWRRYERLPEVMRLAREKAGIERIRELFE